MKAKKTSPAMAFIIDRLKKDRGAKYGDIAEGAKKKRLLIYPIMFGRAQALLGIVKSSPRGRGKAAQAKAARAKAVARTAAPKRRGPGRPRKVANAGAALDGTLDGIVSAVKASQQANARYRNALQKIQSILADALA